MLPHPSETITVKRVWPLLFWPLLYPSWIFFHYSKRETYFTYNFGACIIHLTSYKINTYSFSLYLLNSVVFLCMNSYLTSPLLMDNWVVFSFYILQTVIVLDIFVYISWLLLWNTWTWNYSIKGHKYFQFYYRFPPQYCGSLHAHQE